MDLMDFSRDLDGFIWILEGFVFSGFNFRGIYFFPHWDLWGFMWFCRDSNEIIIGI